LSGAARVHREVCYEVEIDCMNVNVNVNDKTKDARLNQVQQQLLHRVGYVIYTL